jgi:hypothetical protein
LDDAFAMALVRQLHPSIFLRLARAVGQRAALEYAPWDAALHVLRRLKVRAWGRGTSSGGPGVGARSRCACWGFGARSLPQTIQTCREPGAARRWLNPGLGTGGLPAASIKHPPVPPRRRRPLQEILSTAALDDPKWAACADSLRAFATASVTGPVITSAAVPNQAAPGLGLAVGQGEPVELRLLRPAVLVGAGSLGNKQVRFGEGEVEPSRRGGVRL